MEDEEVYGYDPEKKSLASRIFKYSMYGVSLLVYVLLLIRIIAACDGGVASKIILNEKAAALYPGGEVIRVDFPTDEITDGAAFPQNAVYLKDAKVFQLTLKIRTKLLPPSSEGCGYRVELKGLYGEEERVFPLSDHTVRDRFGYRYLRVSFNGVELEGADELVIRLVTAEGKTALSHQVYTPEIYCKSITPDPDDFERI